jgi:hypothetical protein
LITHYNPNGAAGNPALPIATQFGLQGPRIRYNRALNARPRMGEQGVDMQKGAPYFRTFGILLVCTMLAACMPSQVDKSRGETFRKYETLIRWSQWDAAAEFIAPEYLEEHPITRLQMDRLRLFRVTAYTIRSTGIFDDGLTARQVVEIRMFNSHQAVERTVMDEQEWRWDEQRKAWLLWSGLPDPTKRY